MLKVICLALVVTAAVPPFTYRLPAPNYKTYATPNSHGKSPSFISPETTTLEIPVENFTNEPTVENSVNLTKETTVENSGDDAMRITELVTENATILPVSEFTSDPEPEIVTSLATPHPAEISLDTATISTPSQFSRENTDIDFVRINKRKRRRRSSTDPGAESYFTKFTMPPIPAITIQQMTSTPDPLTSATQPLITTAAAGPAITTAEVIQLVSALSMFTGEKNKVTK
jgi:hypothetical protein